MAASDNETLKENKQETEPNEPQQNGKHYGEDEEEKSGKEKNKSGIGKEENIDSPKTPVFRPTRERKTVERYSHTLGALGSASKPLSIEKGRGTQLKDIPNVAYKLSKRKPDDNLQTLHSILYGKKTKAQNLKKNIGQFSGYVWVENEEKNRSKIKEKIDKCVKEKLLVFCDILNIPVSRSTAKKDVLSVKLLGFLESPHSTTDSLLADKEQKSKKLKRKGRTSKSRGSLEKSARNSAKKRKKSEVGETRKQSPKVEDEEEDDEPINTEEESGEDNVDEEVQELGSDQEESGSEEEEQKSKKLKSKGTTSKSTGSLDKAAGKLATKQTKSEVVEKHKKSPNVEEEDDDDDEPSKNKDESEEDTVEEVNEVGSDQEESGSAKEEEEDEDEEDEDEEKPKKKKSKEDISSTKIPRDSGKATEKPKDVKKDNPAKSSKSSTKSSTASKRGSSGADSLAKPKKQKVEKKSKEENESVKENASTKKQSTKSPAKVSEKEGKRKSGKKAKAEPNNEEIHAAAVNILKEVDFNSATLSDIIRQLGSHFGVDLMHKKAEVKAIITDVLDNMSDKEECDDPEAGDEEEKTQDDNTDE